MWRALRPEQWIKNLFVLLPFVFSHRLFEGTAAAWVAFFLLAIFGGLLLNLTVTGILALYWVLNTA